MMDKEVVLKRSDIKEDRLVIEEQLCEEREILGEQLKR